MGLSWVRAATLARRRRTYLLTGADWLQGPYVYPLYHEQYAFPERVVATLFVTGFLSAGISAPLVGAFADQQSVIKSRKYYIY